MRVPHITGPKKATPHATPGARPLLHWPEFNGPCSVMTTSSTMFDSPATFHEEA